MRKEPVVLFFIAPIVSELLFGSTPLSRIQLLPIEALLYGSGAVLVREYAQRRQLGSLSIILLGTAFGIIEECILLQSAFNPTFLHLDLTFGRRAGINMVWAQYIIVYHAFWSITIPILLTRLIFPRTKNDPWINRMGVSFMAVLYVLAGVMHYVIFLNMSSYQAPFLKTIVAAVISGGLIVLASRFGPGQSRQTHLRPSNNVVGLTSFVMAIGWLFLLGLVFQNEAGLSPWSVQVAGLALLLSFILLLSGWLRMDWTELHTFSAVAGGLAASSLFGLVVLIEMHSELDVIAQGIFMIIGSWLMYRLYRHTASRQLPPSEGTIRPLHS